MSGMGRRKGTSKGLPLPATLPYRELARGIFNVCCEAASGVICMCSVKISRL